MRLRQERFEKFFPFLVFLNIFIGVGHFTVEDFYCELCHGKWPVVLRESPDTQWISEYNSPDPVSECVTGQRHPVDT